MADCNVEAPLEKEVPIGPGGTRLSTTSAAYDRGGKGYLDDAEKQMRQMDTKNKGYLEMDDVHKIVEDKLRVQRGNRELKWGMVALVAVVVILAVANLGTAYLAVSMSKDVVPQQDGTLVATADNDQVIQTRALGYTFEVQEEIDSADNSTYYCASVDDVAALWKEAVQDASSVNFVAHSTEIGADVPPGSTKVTSMHLSSDGSADWRSACFVTAGRDKKLCAQFVSDVYNPNKCMTTDDEGEQRRLSPVEEEEVGRQNSVAFHRKIAGYKQSSGRVTNAPRRLQGNVCNRSADWLANAPERKLQQFCLECFDTYFDGTTFIGDYNTDAIIDKCCTLTNSPASGTPFCCDPNRYPDGISCLSFPPPPPPGAFPVMMTVIGT